MSGHQSATGVVFSISRNIDAAKEQDDSAPSSTKGSPTPSIRDTEKAESSFEDDEKALAKYLVPALEKGQKNARLKPVSRWIQFRVWYNPYRMVCSSFLRCAGQTLTEIPQNFSIAFVLNIIGIIVAACGKFPYAEMHGPALALGNITASVACRNEFFLRYFVYWPLVHAFQKVRHLRTRNIPSSDTSRSGLLFGGAYS